MKNCIFCKIIKGEIPSFKIAEDKNFLAFLSIAPINPGHTLVIPKKHTEYIFGFKTTDEILSKILIFSRPIAEALKKAVKPKTGKIGIMVAGLEVLHTHIHLIPMDAEKDLTFSRAKLADMEELKQIAEAVKLAL